MQASVVVAHGLSRCGSWALEHRFSSCGARASLLHSTWDLPGPGIEPVSPALAGGFLITGPPGKSPAVSYCSELVRAQKSILPCEDLPQKVVTCTLSTCVRGKCKRRRKCLSKQLFAKENGVSRKVDT